MTQTDALLRAEALDAYEAIPSLDAHGEVIRLILAEITLLAHKYRNVRRHDIPHIAELSGLVELLLQEMDMARAVPPEPKSAFPQL